MIRLLSLFACIVFAVTAIAIAVPEAHSQEAKATIVKAAASKVSAVTVYQNTALVTREVEVPEAVGMTEVVVSPLPASVLPNTLYAEGAEGVRVLSTRFRSRAVSEDTREEVRKLEAKIKELQVKQQQIQADAGAVAQNMQLLTKLESFTAATLTHLTDKGQLDSEKIIALSNYIRETRSAAVKEEVSLKQQVADLQEELQFTQRKLQESAGSRTRTERDAVIVIDKTREGNGTIRLNYLVSNANWRPQYKLRASGKDEEMVQVEYLAALTQQTGEDWTGVFLTLSTAQPLLNASPPDLLALDIAVGSPQMGLGIGGGGIGGIGGGGFGGGMQGGIGGMPGMPGGPGRPGAGQAPQGAAMPSRQSYLKSLEEQSRGLRQQAQDNLNTNKLEMGGKNLNDAAAQEQYRDLLLDEKKANSADRPAEESDSDSLGLGPSVTYRMKDRLTFPSRNDDQVVEVARIELKPKFYYKSVPVLTSQVYRLADLTNASDFILLPGDATMYLGSDFVGQTKLPLVAIGKPFTVGFGADPQLIVQRKLANKSRVVQGGNQVLTFKYQILLSSYKKEPVEIQVWDRMPHAEAAQTIAISLVKVEPPLSKDPIYLRDERPKNLLRWDVKVDPKQNGESAMTIEYEYKLELALNVNIGAFLAK